MPVTRRPRDSALIDALDHRPRVTYGGPSWRVVREGRNVLQGTRSGGRWDDGTFDVLYTSLEADGAIAEIYYHLTKGLPVIPSKVNYHLHKLQVTISSGLQFLEVKELEELGLSRERFGRLSYVERPQEYPRTQEIAEAAHFLGCDGLIVPSARWKCQNLIVFTDRSTPATLFAEEDTGRVDWVEWKQRTGQA
jgi:hypothetical protein